MNLRTSGVMVLSAVVLLAETLSPASADPLHDSLQKLRAKINAAKQAKQPAKNPNPKSTPAAHPRPRRTASLPVHVPRFPDGAVPPPKAGRPVKMAERGYSISYESDRTGKNPNRGDVRVVTDTPMDVTINLNRATSGHAESVDLKINRKAQVQVRPSNSGAAWRSIFVIVKAGQVAIVHVKPARKPKG